METRANYVLIGAFALAGFLGLLGFFMWFANVQLDRQFAYYEIDFETVSGLSDASDVRFAGLTVGQVVDVRLAPSQTGLVRARIEIAADTPVRTDSIATIEAQGVTGVSYVGITAGTPAAALLQDDSTDDTPRITAGRSVLQSLTQDAPAILSETLEAVREVRQLIGADNQQRIENILQNVEQSSLSFSEALADFSQISETVSNFAREIDRFNTTLTELSTDVTSVLDAAETAFVSLDTLAGDASTVLEEGSTAIAQARETLASADRYLAGDLVAATDAFAQSLEDIRAEFVALSEEASSLIATYATAGETATARLQEAEATLAATNDVIARIDSAMTSVEVAADRFDELVAGDGEALIVDLREAVAQANEVLAMISNTAEVELPTILADVRRATRTAEDSITTIAEDLTSASGRIDQLTLSATEALEAASTTFANANDTLAAINAALATGDRALSAAEQAFAGADRFMNDDLAAITESLQATLTQLEATIGQVAADIPAITEDLRAASRSAQEAFAQVEGAFGQSAPAVRDFATDALPQYGRLAEETRALIDNLDTLVDQIRRDPSRFFLDPRAPEFRR